MNFEILQKNNYIVNFLKENDSTFSFHFPKNLILKLEEFNIKYSLFLDKEILLVNTNGEEKSFKIPSYAHFSVFYIDLLFKYSLRNIFIKCTTPNFIEFFQQEKEKLEFREKRIFDCLIDMTNGNVPSVQEDIRDGFDILSNIILNKGLN